MNDIKNPINTAIAALTMATELFISYANLHHTKGTLEGREKAHRNAEAALITSSALSDLKAYQGDAASCSRCGATVSHTQRECYDWAVEISSYMGRRVVFCEPTVAQLKAMREIGLVDINAGPDEIFKQLYRAAVGAG